MLGSAAPPRVTNDRATSTIITSCWEARRRMRVVIVTARGAPDFLRARTERALARCAITVDACVDEGALPATLDGSPTWILRAGAWPTKKPKAPPASATGKPLIAFGAIALDPKWEEALATSAGDLSSVVTAPTIASVYIENPKPIDQIWEIAREGAHRVVRWHAIDVGYDASDRVRVCLAVTTLHRGGAERVVLDLARALEARGASVLVAVVDRPQRETYDVPEGAWLVYANANGRAKRIAALGEACARFGADVVHAHLLDGDELHALARTGANIVTTLHNDRPGFPARLEALAPHDVALFLRCSWRVTDAARAERQIPVRIAQNGIDQSRLGGAPYVDASELRVLCVANPRPQKRLELAVETIALLRSNGHDARLVLAGAPLGAFDEAVTRFDLASFVTRTGSVADVATLYANADVLLTTSLYEGLSIVHLEALASGVPVVTTDVGGATELSRAHRHYHVADATPEALAQAITNARTDARDHALAPAFTVRTMAARHESLYRSAASARRSEKTSVVLVTNNFSTGGAQASARRLLLGLHARGVDVATAVLEEQAKFPSPWRAELEAAGICTFVAPRAGAVDPAVTSTAIVDFARARRAATLLFWNVIPEHKILIADAAFDLRVIDVSPGEMYFASLDRYFEKPRTLSPYLEPRDYGTLLSRVVVKYAAEAERAARVLGAPVTVIPNGVVVPALARERRANGHVTFGTLARISPDKKIEELVHAVKHAGSAFAGCELRVAGGVERGCDGYANELRELARDLPIAFVGEVESSAFLGELDAFAMISEPEGCPNASLEAMASGLPIVATNAGGASEQIDHECNGLLVPRGDSIALAAALARLARDPKLRADYGRQGHARAAARFDVDRMVSAYAALLSD